MHAMAFVGQSPGARRAVALERRQHARQIAEGLGFEVVAHVEFLGGDVGVQGVDPDTERQIALELGGRPGEHQVAALLGLPAEL